MQKERGDGGCREHSEKELDAKSNRTEEREAGVW